MTEDQCRLIGEAVSLFPCCRLLVFGVGRDSPMWRDLNPNGTTLFLEHDRRWLHEVRSRHPDLDVLPVTYTTNIEEWRELLDRPARLQLDLPDRVRGTRWDVLIVDGPPGMSAAMQDGMAEPIHGRMQSIAAARDLVTDGGVVFVDDTNREVESKYAYKFLGSGAGRRLFTWRSRRRNGAKVEMMCFHFPGRAPRTDDRSRRLRWAAAKMNVFWLFGVRALWRVWCGRVRAVFRADR